MRDIRSPLGGLKGPFGPRRGSTPLWGDDFVMTVQTTATPETFTIPCAAGTYDAVIDWGDGGPTSAITAFNDADLAHSYAAPGTYTVRISGQFPYIHFSNTGDRAKVRTVEQMGRVSWASMQSSFYGCSGMTKFVAGNCDWSGNQSFANTFRNCTALTTIDLSGIITVRPTTMNNCFLGASALTSLDMSGFDFSACVNMVGAFRSMTNLSSLSLPSDAVTSACTNLNNMFSGSAALDTLDTSGWDTSAVTDFTSAFRNMGALDCDISGFRFNAASLNSTFMSGTTLATAQYDAALIEWDGIDVPNGLSWDFGTSKYTGGGAAEAARAALVSVDFWIIVDGGVA